MSSFVFTDRTQETTNTTGLGTLTLLGASTQYQAFSNIGTGNQTCYTVLDGDGVHWFTAVGTYSGGTLTRDQILQGSNGVGANVSLSASTPHLVFADSAAALQTTLIGKYTTVGGDTNHTFSSIPQWFTDLELVVVGRATTVATTQSWSITVNGLGTGIYSSGREYWPGSTAGSSADQVLAQTNWDSQATMAGASAPANNAGMVRARIFNYTASTFYKQIEWTGRQPNSTTTQNAFSILGHAQIDTLTAITSLTVTIDVNQWVAGSTFTLRGIW